MRDQSSKKSWIQIESFNDSHSWKQTWMLLGGAFVVFAFALLYEIDKDLRCKPEQAAINSVLFTSQKSVQSPESITLQAAIKNSRNAAGWWMISIRIDSTDQRSTSWNAFKVAS